MKLYMDVYIFFYVLSRNTKILTADPRDISTQKQFHGMEKKRKKCKRNRIEESLRGNEVNEQVTILQL